MVRIDCGVDDPDDGECDWRRRWRERRISEKWDSAGEKAMLTKAEELPSNHTCVAPPPALADDPVNDRLSKLHGDQGTART